MRHARPWFESIYREEQNEDGGDGGGSDGGSPDVAAQIETATKGLRESRDKILAERKRDQAALKELQTQLDAVGGEDGLKSLAELNSRLQKDELGKLLAEGKYQDAFDKQSAALRSGYEAKLTAAEQAREKEAEARTATQQRLDNLLLDQTGTAAALKAGIAPEVLDDVKLWIQKEFRYSEEHGQPVTLDSDGAVRFGRDGKPLTIAEWLEDSKETKRHWWPASQGGGAGGQGGVRSQGGSRTFDGMTPADFQREYSKQFGKGK